MNPENQAQPANTVRVRFAPSPTGDLHIGGVRTALFNYLYARNKGGTFLLRIEDSDIERSTDESTKVILDGMAWLGMTSDEDVVFQSSRNERHQAVLNTLVSEGKAYYCDCSPELLAEKREKALKEGGKPKYDGRCRNRNLGPEGNALRFRIPDTGTTEFTDLIRGHVVFQNEELDDLIICRSNKTPTYNFLVVVDDIDMNITHVIRGEDHVNNTPRQILLYNALGAQPPQFAHLPIVLGPDKTRLSKRHGATSVLQYQSQGFLPDALLNYIARLGWGHGDQEIFTRDELIAHFNIENVNKAAAVFDMEKLLWVNAQHLKIADIEIITRMLEPFLDQQDFDVPDDYSRELIVELFRERVKTLVEMAAASKFIFEEPTEYDPNGAKKFLRPVMLEHFEELIRKCEELSVLDRKSAQKIIEAILEKNDMKLGKLAQPIRVAVTGTTISPGIYEVLEALGKEKVLTRLKKAVDFMKARAAQ